MPLDEDVVISKRVTVKKKRDEEDAGDKDDAAITAPMHTDSSQMSEPPITACRSSEVKRKKTSEWFRHKKECKEGGQREIKIKLHHSIHGNHIKPSRQSQHSKSRQGC